jgi:hypothetical protein
MQPTVSHAESGFRKTSQLFVLLAAEKLLFWLLQLKYSLSFSDVGFGDAGANFTMHYLSGLGLRAALDFGYLYGLLPLLIGRSWFGLFGPTPMSLAVLALVCWLVVVWSIARIAVRYSIGIPAIVFVVVALPYAVGVFTGLNIAHHLEAALLSVGLAEQAYGRRSTALALATAACLTKPSAGLCVRTAAADIHFRGPVSAQSRECRGNRSIAGARRRDRTPADLDPRAGVRRWERRRHAISEDRICRLPRVELRPFRRGTYLLPSAGRELAMVCWQPDGTLAAWQHLAARQRRVFRLADLEHPRSAAGR